MNQAQSRRQPRLYLVLATLFALLIAGAIVFSLMRKPRGPELLNLPTKAREARPLTAEPDPRFDPLPFEQEKHGK